MNKKLHRLDPHQRADVMADLARRYLDVERLVRRATREAFAR